MNDKETEELRAKNLKIIMDFLKEMGTQNNRFTASPFFYQIRTRKDVVAVDGSEDHYEYFVDDTCEEEVYGDELEEDEDKNEELSDDRDENENGKVKWTHTIPMQKAYEYKGMFLTESDAKQHLKLNHYHYSSDACTYVDHAWRAYGLEEFLKALFLHFGMEPTNSYKDLMRRKL